VHEQADGSEDCVSALCRKLLKKSWKHFVFLERRVTVQCSLMMLQKVVGPRARGLTPLGTQCFVTLISRFSFTYTGTSGTRNLGPAGRAGPTTWSKSRY
jgi:hypothetical protein